MAGNSITNDFWFTAVLNYLGYALISITKMATGHYEFVIACPELDFAELRQEYDSRQGLAVGNVKSFNKSWNAIMQVQKEMRRTGENQWTSREWQRGEIR